MSVKAATPTPSDSSTKQLAIVRRKLNQIILGKAKEMDLALACLLAGGHLLIEDVPGVGKTTLAHALAVVLGLGFQRIQFTSDLLPADIIGVSIYRREEETFTFHPGPLFSHVVLADEVNRATPRTQSALLEAMEERQVSADGITRPLPRPFFVLATQNPFTQIGTYPLPESQLDRFLVRLKLGYPDPASERALYQGVSRQELIATTRSAMDPGQVGDLIQQSQTLHVAPALLDYVQALVRHTRESGWYEYGLSPRAGLAMIRLAQAWAFLHEAPMVTPDDLQAILPSVVGHRLLPKRGAQEPDEMAQDLLSAVPIP